MNVPARAITLWLALAAALWLALAFAEMSAIRG
jgi:hypothetical protein